MKIIQELENALGEQRAVLDKMAARLKSLSDDEEASTVRADLQALQDGLDDLETLLAQAKTIVAIWPDAGREVDHRLLGRLRPQ